MSHLAETSAQYFRNRPSAQYFRNRPD